MQILSFPRRIRRLGPSLWLATALSWLPLSNAADPPAWLTADIDPIEQPTATGQRSQTAAITNVVEGVRGGLISPGAPQFVTEEQLREDSAIQQTSFVDNGFAEYLAETSDVTLSTREVSPSRGLWRMPDLMGTLLRLGPQHDVTFRPIATIPAPSPGTVVLDAASNRFVYTDGSSETLVPGAPGLGTDFVTFVVTGGGDINATAGVLPDGTRGYFGLTRITQDAGSGMTTQSLPGFDLLSQTPPGSMTITTVGVTNPISTVNYNAEPHTAHFSVTGPSPTNPSLATVGVNRQADGGSVIPRNRVFFQYSYFDSVALGQGIDLHRFTPGFETTLAHGLMSLEARFPFASTLDASPVLNGTVSSNEVEFGNVSLHLKSVLAGGDDWLLSAGLQVTLPTADDYSLLINDRGRSAEFLRLENDTVHLMPFLGMASAPNDRFFTQSIVQLDFDGRGRSVKLAPNALNGGSLTSIGRLNDAAFLYFDSNVGYWLLSDPEVSTRMVTGVAPVFELHSAIPISGADRVGFAPLGSLGTTRDYSILTATFGCVFELWHTTLLQVGYSSPIEGGSNEDFDGEFRAMVSRRFGSR
jgi:hypothetical protein